MMPFYRSATQSFEQQKFKNMSKIIAVIVLASASEPVGGKSRAHATIDFSKKTETPWSDGQRGAQHLIFDCIRKQNKV